MRLEDLGPAALLAAGLILVSASARGPGGQVSAAGAAASHAEAPPPGHTGGFGEPTCQVCHAEYALDLDGGSLSVEGLPERYTAGTRYVLTITLRSSEMERSGFELALRHPDGRQAGRLSPVDGTTAVTEADGIQYAHQTEEGSTADSPEVASWAVEWTAPASADEVRLHAAANSANGDNSPFGDLVYTTSDASGASVPAPPPQR